MTSTPQRQQDQRSRLLVLSYWGSSAGYSGPARLLSRLFAGIHENLQVDLGCTRSAGDTTESWPARTYAVSSRGAHFGRWNQLCWVIGVSRLLVRRRNAYDFVHLHGLRVANLLPAALLIWLRRRAVIFPVVEDGELSRDRRGPLAALLRYVVSRAHVGFALTPGIAAELEFWGMANERVVAIGNPVDTTQFAPAPSTGTAEGETVVGFVGSVGSRKGAALLAGAIARCTEDDHVRGLFVGPVEPSALHLLWRREIEFTGYIGDPAERMREMTMFALPSASEGLPGALAEAMATGLPCIVSDAGGMATVVSEARCGLVIERSEDALRDAIRVLANDASLRRALGRQARAYALAVFSVEAVGRRYRQAIQGEWKVSANP